MFQPRGLSYGRLRDVFGHLKSGALALAFGLAVLPIKPVLAQQACPWDAVELRGPFGRVHFRTEVMDTDASRARGLMHRAHLGATESMLFAYDKVGPVAFWMKNTLIPLDMVFLDETGRVAFIHANAIPHDETPIFGGNAIQYVLEIKGGLAAVLGLQPGDEMRHPVIATPAWPCP